MLKKNKVSLVATVLVLLGLSGFSQNNNTTSPYSRYGLGDLHHYGYGRTAAMGGASIGSRHSVQINSANPASYNSNDSLSFIFDFGIDGKYSTLGTMNEHGTGLGLVLCDEFIRKHGGGRKGSYIASSKKNILESFGCQWCCRTIGHEPYHPAVAHAKVEHNQTINNI